MSRHPRQLSPPEVAAIRASDETVTVTELALKHNVNRGVISNARRGVTYKYDADGLSYSGWPDGRIGEGCTPRKTKGGDA